MNFITSMLKAEEQRDLKAVRDYCEKDGYVEDFDNIFMPLYKKYGWELIRDIGDIQWERIDIEHYIVTYLNLDRLSTLVEWDENKQRFIPIKN